MDVQALPSPADKSLENDEDPALKINEPEVGEEEDQFFDAGENVQDSSDIVAPDLNFSEANEGLASGGSDHSEPSSPTIVPAATCHDELILDNLDDTSTRETNGVDGSNSPRPNDALTKDDDELPEGSQPAITSDSELHEDAVSQLSSNDAVHLHSTSDFSQNEAEKSSDAPLHDAETSSDAPLHDVINVDNSNKSSMEVMEDESESLSSKRSSPEKVVLDSDVCSNEVVAEVVEKPAEGGDIISENMPPDSTDAEEDAKNSETNEILRMDDSDVDESLQENLDAAIKVVEENQSSPTPSSTAEGPQMGAKTDDSANSEDLDTASKSNNILEEFQDDAAKINGSSQELLDSRLCPCQVVLFKIDFDEYAPKNLRKKRGTVNWSADRDTDTTLDTPSSKTSDSDWNSESAPLKTTPKSSTPNRRVLTKAARKMIPTPETVVRTPRRCVRTSRTPATAESTRPRRQARQVAPRSSKYAPSDSTSSDDEIPLPVASGRRRAAVNGAKRLAQSAQKASQRTSPRKGALEEVKNIAKELYIDLSGERTLKCVSIPVITDLIDSIKEKSYSELMALIEQKQEPLSSRVGKSKSVTNRSVKRGSQRRKLSPIDNGNSSAKEDDDYRPRGKIRKYDDGAAREDDNFSSRSEAKSTAKRSSRNSAAVRNYVEDSASDDEILSKKAKTRSGDESSEEEDTGSDGEKAISPKKNLKSKKRTRKRAQIRKNAEDSKSDDESPLTKERTSKRKPKNSTECHKKEAEDFPEAKTTPSRRSSRKSTTVLKYVEDSASEDVSPLKKNVTDSDDERVVVSSKAKSRSNQRSSRKSARSKNYVEDSKSDDESSSKTENTSKENLTHGEHNEINDTNSDDEKTEVSSKAKSSRRSSRKSAKAPEYVEDSEADDESPVKKQMRSRKNPISQEECIEKNDTDSGDEKTEDSSNANSVSNNRLAGENDEVENLVADSKSDDESPLKKESASRDASTDSEDNQKNNTDNHDEEAEDSPKGKSTSSKRSARKTAKVQKYVDDSDSDDKAALKTEKAGRKNSTHLTDSDDDKVEDSPKTPSTLNKRSGRRSAKVPKYVEDSASDDESPVKKERSSKRKSTSDTDSDEEEAEDSPKTKSISNKRSRTIAKAPNYVDNSESDDNSTLKKESTSGENSTHLEENGGNRIDSDDENFSSIEFQVKLINNRP